MQKKWFTREVFVGNLAIGGENPVRVQSMTTSNTRDIKATVDQIVKLSDYGCEIVRVTVQGNKEAESCEEIKNLLIQKGCLVPLVADIHFYPPAALKVVDSLEKVRINPGNFADRRASFKKIEYSDAEYQLELEKIEEKFTPLVTKCKKLDRAMRIGTNHGSLSDRILNRFGDTPRGMVESAFEYARIARKHDFHSLIFSMKSSNPKVMIEAYRLLVDEMTLLGWDYPIHLGVTEAGEGEDGRVKSAIGIGSLLIDGIGDTIRVSLTEDPWFEMDPCRRLSSLANLYRQDNIGNHVRQVPIKRNVVFSKQSFLHKDGTCALAISNSHFPSLITSLLDNKEQHEQKPDCLFIQSSNLITETDIQNLQQAKVGIYSNQGNGIPFFQIAEAEKMLLNNKSEHLFTPTKWPNDCPIYALIVEENNEDWEKILPLNPSLIVFRTKNPHKTILTRKFFAWLNSKQLTIPVLLNFVYDLTFEDMVIFSSAECGSLLCDGMAEGLLLEGPYHVDQIKKLSFNILQGARMRTTKTEFISCPSCGRTLFNLQEVSKRIREKTGHLPGVKIAVMGCIVNGPGEMADADFGYVGTRPDKVDLYVGKQCVEKNIDHQQADHRLIELIKTHGKWVDAKVSSEPLASNL